VNTDLAGKVVIVTGASGGIGSGIAQAFAAEGARVVLHYHRGRERVLRLQAALGASETLVVRADLCREVEVARMFERIRKRFGRADTLVANAGAWETRDTPLHRMSLEQWRKTQDGVLTTTFLSVRGFLQLVERQGQGNIVLIASTAAVFGEAGHADYAAAKAAIAYGLTRSLKNEIARVAPHTASYCGGRVNCICPGWTVVPRLARKLSDPAMVRKAMTTMALPQLGRPEDIGQAAVFLASDRLARHITGQILPIAGGMEGRSLWSPEELESAAT
jgi:3-oxoacyl-[acyl-carrier protein] reductase